MHPIDIQASMIKRGKRPAAVARDLGVSRMAVSHVIYGRSKSRRIAKAISRATGLPVAELWPGKYIELDQQAA